MSGKWCGLGLVGWLAVAVVGCATLNSGQTQIDRHSFWHGLFWSPVEPLTGPSGGSQQARKPAASSAGPNRPGRSTPSRPFGSSGSPSGAGPSGQAGSGGLETGGSGVELGAPAELPDLGGLEQESEPGRQSSTQSGERDGVSDEPGGSSSPRLTAPVPSPLPVPLKGGSSAEGPSLSEPGGTSSERAKAEHGARLRLEIDSPKQAQVGGFATYRLTVVNEGDRAARDVVIEAEFVPPLEMPGRKGTHVRQSLGTVLPGDRKTVSLTLTSKEPGLQPCQFRVFVEGKEAVWKSVVVEFVSQRVELGIVGPSARLEGSRAEFLFKLTNVSDVELRNVRVAVENDAALQPREASSGVRQEAGRLEWNVGNLAPGEGVQLQVEYECPFAAQDARVALAVRGDNVPADEVESYVQIVPRSDVLNVQVSDTVDPVRVGGVTEYRISVTNEGLRPVGGLVLRVQLPRTFRLEQVETRLDDYPFELSYRTESEGRLVFGPLGLLPPDIELTVRLRVRAVQVGDGRLQVEAEHQDSGRPVGVSEPTTVNP